MNVVIIHAQYEFRPIIDSSTTCSYFKPSVGFSENPLTSKQILEIFYIVEKMPSPKIPESEIETILKDNIRFNVDEMTKKGEIYLQCVVNCKGKAGDFQIIHCPSEFVNIGCQLLNIFSEKFNIWEAGQLRDKNIDTLIKVKVTFYKGDFKIEAPSY